MTSTLDRDDFPSANGTLGSETIGRIVKKAKPLDHLHGANVNSTYSGGGVAELLTSFTLLMNNVGIRKL